MAGSERARPVLGYEAYLRLIHQLDDLVAAFEGHPDETTRARAVALLEGLDLLHRQALTRLVEGLREQGAGPALEGVMRDRVVETLLGLYDLAELDVPDEAPPANDGVVFVPRDQLTVGRPDGKGGS